MPVRQAVKAGIYLATMDDSLRDMKRGHFETRRSEEEELALERQLEERRQQARGIKVVKRGIKRQRHHQRMNSFTASLADVSAKLNQKAQQQIAAKLFKFTYHKNLRPLWKMLARFRTLTTFTPAQMRQFFYGVALTMHLFTKYNKRMTNLNQQLRSVFILVVVPFSIPPLVVLVIPTLLFLIPLVLLVTAFTALNRRAKAIQELHKKRLRRRRRRYTGSSVFTSVGSKAFRALQESTDRLSDSMNSLGTIFPTRRSTLFSSQSSLQEGDLFLHERSESGVSVSTLASSSYFESSGLWDTSTTNLSQASTSTTTTTTNHHHHHHHQQQQQPSSSTAAELELVSSFESSSSNPSDDDDDDDDHNPPAEETCGSHSHSSSSMVDTTPRRPPRKNSWFYFRTSSNDTPTTEPSTSSLLRPSRFKVERRPSRRASFTAVFRPASQKNQRAQQQQQKRRVSFAVLDEVRSMDQKDKFNIEIIKQTAWHDN